MRRLSSVVAGLVLLAAAVSSLAEGPSTVTMPLDQWEGMLDEVSRSQEPGRPSIPVASLFRSIEGTFSKGLFEGVLVEEIRVLDTSGHMRVPILDGDVSLGGVLLDGAQTSLIREGNMYTLGIDEPGDYTVAVSFYAGEDRDRFARRLRFALPEGGTTALVVEIPEPDIEPTLAGGAVTKVECKGDVTTVKGSLDATGEFNLSWTRKVTHQGDKEAVLEARADTLFSVGESVVTGKTKVSYTVLEGETDMVEMTLPEGLEIIDVEGDAVLQWRTDSNDGGRLAVLLRYLVSGNLDMTVRFQLPTGDAQAVSLLMPSPAGVTSSSGAAGIQAPPNLKVDVASTENAEPLSAVDIPESLAGLSTTPLMYGFSFTEAPKISLKISRHEQVTLTSTLIEEIEASTVVGEDGTEITKLKMRIRNNTREYLAVRLPKGALLTHSLIDGQPFRPALSGSGADANLLIPLRQSERLEDGQVRTHTVRPGETLSDIANFYYSDPGKWQSIISANPSTLYYAHSVTTGQVLSIPAVSGSDTQESSFVVELAYKSEGDALGSLGAIDVNLPKLDVDAMKVTWHLYFPDALEPVSFDANLTQYSSIRYDPFRRARDFFRRALWGGYAWAGGNYENILAKRKAIYRTESDSQKTGRGIRAAFPLVGRQYRFKRILLGQETPEISIRYVDRAWTDIVRWVALLGCLALTLLVLARPRDIKRWVAAAVLLALLLVAAHYVLGTHKRILWGVDLGLLLMVLKLRAGAAWRRVKELAAEPWLMLDILTFKNLLFAVGLLAAMGFALSFPLFVSTVALGVFFFLWRRGVRLAGEEVTHA